MCIKINNDLESFNLEVNGLNTIFDIKCMIKNIKGIDLQKCYLFYNNESLEDSK